MKVVAIVGMAGSGKSETARVFVNNNYSRVRFGDITDREVKKRGLELNEKNECEVRQDLRKKHGMAAYAKLSLPEIDHLLESSDVIVDGLYSWEEYTLMKRHYADNLKVVAVWASPETRYKRLAKRPARPLSTTEALSRDITEIEDSHKAGPIAMADFTIINESSLEDLEKETKRILSTLR